MAATARGNDSGDSGQATTTRAQPRERLEAESDTRRSWRIVDSRLWRAWTGALMVERSQIERGQGEKEEVGAHLLAINDSGHWTSLGKTQTRQGLGGAAQTGRCGEGEPAVGATGWYKLQRR
ncbi:hypothetical protein DY000_02062302 [Brassica cretica]|uniref:Uncharacterized protein n=1 Tax=Brassica cretica TaxID=69181 RepID=A0ABQ7AXP9_BRACR|nr:hypothetical protein DY000_02062302 [Brassica cretica]